MFNAKSLLEKLRDHSKVEDCVQLRDETECLVEITRKGGLPTVRVHISDAYDYSSWDYQSRPSPVDFILIGNFTEQFDHSLVAVARKDRIGIGGFRKLMGALNWTDMWKYELPEDRPHAH